MPIREVRLRTIRLLIPLLLAGSGGCAAIPLATAGTLAGIASSTVDAGGDLYRAGKLDAADLAAFGDVASAAEVAGEEMGFALTDRAAWAGGRVRLAYADDRGAKTVVTVERRTATLTYTRIDVGVFGSETTARLMLRRVRSHLPSHGTDAALRSGSPRVEERDDPLD